MSTKAADRRRNKATKRRGRGHPPFIPTDEQRRFVIAMAGIRMTWEEIRQLVVNPQTGEPITKTTLARAFKRELTNGKAKLKSLVATRFYEALRRGDAWAVQMGLKMELTKRQARVLKSTHHGHRPRDQRRHSDRFLGSLLISTARR
jgi:hypothetical protein